MASSPLGTSICFLVLHCYFCAHPRYHRLAYSSFACTPNPPQPTFPCKPGIVINRALTWGHLLSQNGKLSKNKRKKLKRKQKRQSQLLAERLRDLQQLDDLVSTVSHDANESTVAKGEVGDKAVPLWHNLFPCVVSPAGLTDFLFPPPPRPFSPARSFFPACSLWFPHSLKRLAHVTLLIPSYPLICWRLCCLCL